jgi:predicted DNA-binding transcriptional regulator YafY
MSKRSSTETIVFLLQAFVRQRTWKQADLSKSLGVGVRALRKRLDELSLAGVPLEREEDSPDVFWSVPRGWFPGGAFVPTEDVQLILRQLCRLPRSSTRDGLLRRLVRSMTGRGDDAPVGAGEPSIVPSAAAADEDHHLALVEDAVLAQRAVRIRYVSAHRGDLEWRHVSPLRVFPGPPGRLVAVCHRADALRWFRVDGIVGGSQDFDAAFRTRPAAEIDAFVKASVGGFHDEGAAVPCSFVVREPEARWVARNLIAGMKAEPVAGGVRVSAETTAVLRVARFVVGLGAAATIETPELRVHVEELAQGALRAGASS